jgi:hypothetical protein
VRADLRGVFNLVRAGGLGWYYVGLGGNKDRGQTRCRQSMTDSKSGDEMVYVAVKQYVERHRTRPSRAHVTLPPGLIQGELESGLTKGPDDEARLTSGQGWPWITNYSD